jgi:hypothetical protein
MSYNPIDDIRSIQECIEDANLPEGDYLKLCNIPKRMYTAEQLRPTFVLHHASGQAPQLVLRSLAPSVERPRVERPRRRGRRISDIPDGSILRFSDEDRFHYAQVHGECVRRVVNEGSTWEPRIVPTEHTAENRWFELTDWIRAVKLNPDMRIRTWDYIQIQQPNLNNLRHHNPWPILDNVVRV